MTRPKKPDHNWARVQANTLANVGRAYLSRTLVPATDAEPLRYAAELVELHANVVLRVIEGHPDDLARAAAIASLSRALAHAFTIGNWHYESPSSKEIVQPRLRTKAMREAKDEKSKETQLQLLIRQRQFKFKLAKSEACAKKVLKTLGCADADVSLSTVRRAIKKVLAKGRDPFLEK
jgi:hypothetical protein